MRPQIIGDLALYLDCRTTRAPHPTDHLTLILGGTPMTFEALRVAKYREPLRIDGATATHFVRLRRIYNKK